MLEQFQILQKVKRPALGVYPREVQAHLVAGQHCPVVFTQQSQTVVKSVILLLVHRQSKRQGLDVVTLEPVEQFSSFGQGLLLFAAHGGLTDGVKQHLS